MLVDLWGQWRRRLAQQAQQPSGRKGRSVVKSLSGIETQRDVDDRTTRNLVTAVLAQAVGFDTTFGINGSTQVPFQAYSNILPDFAIAALSNGQTVAVGEGFVLMKFNPDGTADASFGGTFLPGCATATPPAGINAGGARAIFEQSDGRLVIAGESNDGVTQGWLFARFDSDGSLDASFGTNGWVVQSFGCNTHIGGAAYQADGKLLVVGWTDSNDGSFITARYNPDMTLDATFGDAGFSLLPQDFQAAYDPMSVVVQADGRVLVAGSFGSGMSILRYDSTGTLDPSFGSSGLQFLAFPDADTSQFIRMNLQSDGGIIVGGYTSNENQFAVTRLDASGELDPSFGSNGTQLIRFGSPNDWMRDLLVTPDDSILAFGETAQPGAPLAAIAKLTPNGNLDTSFEGDGKAVLINSDASTVIRRAALTADGNVVAILGNGETSSNARVGRIIVNSTVSARRDRVGVSATTATVDDPNAAWELFGQEDWLMYGR